MNKNKALGRGLASLISSDDLGDLMEASSSSGEKIILAKFEDVYSNAGQPRKHFNEEALQELTDSIKQKGIISPVIVRRKTDGKYEIIAGERRYRAAKLAGLKALPIIVKEATDTSSLELSIIENVQRQDLNVIEEAEAYQLLMSKYSHTQEDIATMVGKSRSHVANILRLLMLPTSVIVLLKEGKINMGHAKVLVGRDDAEALASEVVNRKLNVRQIERLIKNGKSKPQTRASRAQEADIIKDEDIILIEELLKEKTDLKVEIDSKKQSITIWYDNLDELDKVLQLLSSK